MSNITFEDDTVPIRRWQRMANYVWNIEEIKMFVLECLAILDFKLLIEQKEIDLLWEMLLFPFYRDELRIENVYKYLEYQTSRVLEE